MDYIVLLWGGRSHQKKLAEGLDRNKRCITQHNLGDKVEITPF